jgi:hypothetical protein
VIFEPFSDRRKRALIHRRFQMRPVKHSPLTEQAHQNTRTFALFDTRPQFNEQSFDIGPTEVRRCRPCENQRQSALVFAPYDTKVAEIGINPRFDKHPLPDSWESMSGLA